MSEYGSRRIKSRHARKLRGLVFGTEPDAIIHELAVDYRAAEGAAIDVKELRLGEDLEEDIAAEFVRTKSYREKMAKLAGAKAIQKAFDEAKKEGLPDSKVRQTMFRREEDQNVETN